MHLEAASDGTFAEIEALLARLDLPTAGLHDQFPRADVVAIDLGAVIGCAGLETYGTAGVRARLPGVHGVPETRALRRDA